MTSTPVNVQGFTSGTVYGTNRIQNVETKGDFSKIFENQKNVSDDMGKVGYAEDEMQEEPKVRETTKNDDEVTASVNRAEEQKSTTVNESEEGGQTSDNTDMEKDALTEEQLSQAAEVLNSAVADIKELLMQQLQLSEEELNSLMQEMNLTDADLLQMGNVKELVLQAVGAQDMTALLTDEGLYTQMKSIETGFAGIMQEVQNTLDIEPDEMMAVAEQVDEFLSVAHADNEDGVMVEITTDTENAGQTEIQGAQKAEHNAGEQSLMQENGAGNAFANQQMQTNATENVQAANTQMTSYATADTENIMRQIMDHMRIQMTADTTELDMQLNPESLGTLQIRISAKEGIMTAQFTTASEAVKGVLESQMIQLQQQLDQQNIKVEAIEVMVQSHAFESALEKGNEHQTGDEPKRNRPRRIDLTNLDGVEDLETEEQLLAEMMEANGNSVDYLV